MNIKPDLRQNIFYKSYADHPRRGFQLHEFTGLFQELTGNEIRELTGLSLISGVAWLGQNWLKFFGRQSRILKVNGGFAYNGQQIVSPHGSLLIFRKILLLKIHLTESNLVLFSKLNFYSFGSSTIR